MNFSFEEIKENEPNIHDEEGNISNSERSSKFITDRNNDDKELMKDTEEINLKMETFFGQNFNFLIYILYNFSYSFIRKQTKRI